MSAISKVGRSVNDMTSFMRDKVKSNIINENNGDGLSLDDYQLKKVLNLIDMSFDQTFSLGFSGVERTLEKVISETRESATKDATSSRKTRSYKK
jgi:hypothetical protein